MAVQGLVEFWPSKNVNKLISGCLYCLKAKIESRKKTASCHSIRLKFEFRNWNYFQVLLTALPKRDIAKKVWKEDCLSSLLPWLSQQISSPGQWRSTRQDENRPSWPTSSGRGHIYKRKGNEKTMSTRSRKTFRPTLHSPPPLQPSSELVLSTLPEFEPQFSLQ